MSDEAGPHDRAHLRRLPQNPRKVTGVHNWVNGFHLFLDYLTTVPPTVQKWSRPFRRVPPGFSATEFQTRDGVRLEGWLGKAADEPRDAVLLLPGLYTSKDNKRIKARAQKIHQEWGYHVFCLDLRGVGGSERAPTTPGWKEAEDIIDAIAHLRATVPTKRIHLYAESLAASAAILAAGMEGRAGRRLLDGHIIAMSPYADAKTIVDLYAHPEPAKTGLGSDFAGVQWFFNTLLRMQGFKGGRFDAYAQHAADHYGVTLPKLLETSSPGLVIPQVNVPLLVVHSEDDGLVPVSEAHKLQAAADGNRHVDVWILPWGYHCLYEMADPAWYWSVLRHVYGAEQPRHVPTERAIALDPIPA